MNPTYESVPNPMANVPSSPLTLSEDGHETKRARGETGIRWSDATAGDSSDATAAGGGNTAINSTATAYNVTSVTGSAYTTTSTTTNTVYNQTTSLNEPHPSSSSLTSSHPSYTSFGSEDHTATPDSWLWGQGQSGQMQAQGQQTPFSQQQQQLSQQPQFQQNPHGPFNQQQPSQQQPANRRTKRLERNRESARLSRKRRKAYLEELETRVMTLGGNVDRERVGMVRRFLGEVRRGLCGGVNVGGVNSGGVNVGGASGINVGTPIRGGIKHSLLPPSSHHLPSPTKIPTTLQIIYTFQTSHLTSLTINYETQLILWLMIQKERFWRGGRGNSERLSAARIGERLLTNGTYKASPNGGMWPLLCHEIGLSYEQEDRVRTTQKAILADSKTWIHRHTAAATKNVLNSIQATVSQQHEAAKRREQSILKVLTPEQRSKFMTWASQKSEAIRRATQSKLAQLNETEKYEINPQRHVAANMYIVDHRLSKIKSQHLPPPTFVHPTKLKKLGRRPCFESLAGQDAIENNTKSTRSNKLNRESSFPSTGSLKRTLTELSSCDDSQPTTSSNALSGITVESAHAAAQPAVKEVFADIMPIVPQAYVNQMNLEHFRPASDQDAMPPPSTTSEPQALYAPSRVTSSIPRQSQFSAPPTISSDDIDIPMPTPVSVLVRTHDEFLDVDDTPGVPLEVTSAMQPPEPMTVESGYIPSIEYAPDPISSQSRFAMRSYQSAPQLYTGDDFYPAVMPTVPEESFHRTSVEEDEFADLEELGDPNDWAIGESFDMGMDGSGSPS